MCKNVRRVREAVPPCYLVENVENSTFFAGFEVFAQRGSLKNPKKLIVPEGHDYVWQFEGYDLHVGALHFISSQRFL